MITGISIESVESPTFAGTSFAGVGQYERLTGRAFGELDPQHLQNQTIVDLSLAPRNERGAVEYVTDFQIFKPLDPARGSGVLLYDVNNRGRPLSWIALNHAFEFFAGEPDQYIPLPTEAADVGLGHLMREGYTLALCGWDATAASGLTISVPIALDAEGPVTGPAWEEVRSDGRMTRWPLTYPPASLDPSHAQLTERRSLDGPRAVVPSSEWGYIDNGAAIGLRPLGEHPFEAGVIYEFSYQATAALILGIGFAAVRDFVSYLRYDTHDMDGSPNPIGATATHAISFGMSQAGRFHRTFLSMGMNADERGRRVLDGMLPYINGAGGGFFNYRFGQPGRTGQQLWAHLFPEQVFPFAYAVLTDPLTGRTAGVLARYEDSDCAPRILEVNDSNSYWTKCASLVTTTPDGLDDAAVPDNVRVYLLAGVGHTVTSGAGSCRHPRNPATPNAVLRALLRVLTEWVVHEIEPPPSCVPRISDGSLVAPGDVDFPQIPGVTYEGLASSRELFDYGPDFERGILANVPPTMLDAAYRTLVPQADADGTDLAGIRTPDVAAPIGTHTGWNMPAAGSRDYSTFYGSFLQFASTRADRLASGDPRLSLEERYGDHAGYVAAVRVEADRLVERRLLLPEDADLYVELAQHRATGLPTGSAPSRRSPDND